MYLSRHPQWVYLLNRRKYQEEIYHFVDVFMLGAQNEIKRDLDKYKIGVDIIMKVLFFPIENMLLKKHNQ